MSKTGYDQWMDDIAKHLQKKGVGNGNAPPPKPKENTAMGGRPTISYSDATWFLQNVDPHKRREMIAALITDSMSWASTPEGDAFWRNIYLLIKKGPMKTP